MSFGIDDAIAAALKVLDKFVPDPEARAKAEADLRNALQSWDKAQSDVNAVEAANASVFVSGWRPFLGWCCGAALAYQYLISPLIMWVALSAGANLASPPRLDDSLWELMFGMLGLGGLRTLEKIKGVASK